MERWIVRCDSNWDEEAVRSTVSVQLGEILDERTVNVDGGLWTAIEVTLPDAFDRDPWQAAGLWPFAFVNPDDV